MPNCTTFLDVNARFGDKPALIHPASGSEYSYRQLLERVCRQSSCLIAHGIVAGDRVGIYLPASPEYLFWYFAIWRMGGVAVPLNNVLRADEVASLMEDSGSVCMITDSGGSIEVESLVRDGRITAEVIVTDTRSFEEECRSVPLISRACNCRPDDLCQLQYTSGTTGKQKGAMLTHANWMAAMDNEREVLRYREDDVYLGIYPMAHVGVSWGISALRAGATWVVMDRFSLDEYVRLTETYHATVVAGMPPVIHSLLRTPPGTEERMCSAREMISGGGPLHPSIWKEFFSRFEIPVVNAYGLSETIVVGTGTAIRPEDYESADEFRSVGMPVGYTEVKIVNTEDPDTECDVGEVGEIALRGPAIASGYWGMEEETQAVFLPDGWFLTGDIGYLSESGMLAITDRKKDMIVMSGWKIYPTEVEKALINHPLVDDVAVFGVPDVHRGEIPYAAVVLVPGATLTLAELQEYAREYLAGYKVPREMVIVEELPRVGGWKLLRRELREKYGPD
ncbi:class I adenylate-forming enzyme family protein [Methanogenium organophilum]|uniref:Class I adenylate-forming enzyme family protein n=1 Tax=Methanogenium organophilum TaxID=2199 RepID=A0A9X9S351_METOG|nr:class I adenylate-forming enzyme family protein [Methanogenium organophilum]WAI00666.1 class I adenylate-forming enzyme family protein [Methanogenium organophilum]